MHDLRKVRRTDFFFAFRREYEVHRNLAPGAANRVQRRQKRSLGTFLIDRATADQNFSKIGYIHHRGLEWWRLPLRGIELSHVMHEVETDGARGACVERGKNAGLDV